MKRKKSNAKITTKGLEAHHQDNVEDLKEGKKHLKEFLSDPKKAAPYFTYRTKRLKSS